jgi:hypothetical protein
MVAKLNYPNPQNLLQSSSTQIPKFVAKLKYPHQKNFATNFVMWVLGKALTTDNYYLLLMIQMELEICH